MFLFSHCIHFDKHRKNGVGNDDSCDAELQELHIKKPLMGKKMGYSCLRYL
jgi:hypothetical protein